MSQVNSVFRRQVEAVTGAKTLDEGDSGVVQNVTATAIVTLPATVVGRVYTVRVGADAINVTIAPNASDKVMGNGYTSADNKYVRFTSQQIGCEVTLLGDGANGWHVVSVQGTLTKEA